MESKAFGPARHTAKAAALKGKDAQSTRMTVKGEGAFAEQILALAFENDVKVRQDPALMEMLSLLDEDSPLPTDALAIVTDILARIYAASQHPTPDKA